MIKKSIPQKRTLPIWTNHAIKILIVLVPLAYSANGISNEVTLAVLVLLGGLNLKDDKLGVEHRKLTEESKKIEVANGEAP